MSTSEQSISTFAAYTLEEESSPAIGTFAAAVVVISGLTDLVGKWRLGAFVTITCVIWCWLPLRVRLREVRRLWPALYPFFGFIVWAFLSCTWQAPFVSGLQNFAVLLAFFGLILHNSDAANATLNRRFSTALVIAVGGAGVLYAISLLMEGPGSSFIFGARVFGLFALVGISWYLARWYSGATKTFLYAAVLLLLIALSLSRMAFAIGLSLFALASFVAAWRGKRLRLLAIAIMVVSIGVTAMLRFKPLSARIEGENGTTMSSLDFGDSEVDTSGRLVMWAVVWESYLDSPWIGKGMGSSADLVQGALLGIDHPHCDYLMLLHDYGVVGLMLFLLGLINLVYNLHKKWRASRQADGSNATVVLAAMFLLIAIMIAMTTDNCLSYTYLMAPLAVMIGMSLRKTARRGECEQ